MTTGKHLDCKQFLGIRTVGDIWKSSNESKIDEAAMSYCRNMEKYWQWCSRHNLTVEEASQDLADIMTIELFSTNDTGNNTKIPSTK